MDIFWGKTKIYVFVVLLSSSNQNLSKDLKLKGRLYRFLLILAIFEIWSISIVFPTVIIFNFKKNEIMIVLQTFRCISQKMLTNEHFTANFKYCEKIGKWTFLSEICKKIEMWILVFEVWYFIYFKKFFKYDNFKS